MRAKAGTALALLLVLGTAGTAGADEDEFTKVDWPIKVIERPITLAGSMFEARGDTMFINLSDGAAGEPVSLAPDLYYGVNGQLTVGVNHDRGFCLTSDGCPTKYNDVTAEVQYGVMRGGNLQFALRGGLTFPRFDPVVFGVTVGFVLRLRAGAVAILTEPALYAGIVERDPAEGGQKETLFLPGWLQVQLQEQLMVFLSSGVFGQLDGFGDGFRIPVGLGLTYALNNRIDVGFEFQLTNVAGKDQGDPTMGGTEAGIDGRALFLRIALRL